MKSVAFGEKKRTFLCVLREWFAVINFHFKLNQPEAFL